MSSVSGTKYLCYLCIGVLGIGWIIMPTDEKKIENYNVNIELNLSNF